MKSSTIETLKAVPNVKNVSNSSLSLVDRLCGPRLCCVACFERFVNDMCLESDGAPANHLRIIRRQVEKLMSELSNAPLDLFDLLNSAWFEVFRHVKAQTIRPGEHGVKKCNFCSNEEYVSVTRFRSCDCGAASFCSNECKRKSVHRCDGGQKVCSYRLCSFPPGQVRKVAHVSGEGHPCLNHHC